MLIQSYSSFEKKNKSHKVDHEKKRKSVFSYSRMHNLRKCKVTNKFCCCKDTVKFAKTFHDFTNFITFASPGFRHLQIPWLFQNHENAGYQICPNLFNPEHQPELEASASMQSSSLELMYRTICFRTSWESPSCLWVERLGLGEHGTLRLMNFWKLASGASVKL